MIKGGAEWLDETMTRRGELVTPDPSGGLACLACAHRCIIQEGSAGICGVRYNAGGILRVPANWAVAVRPDPVEKKPFFHVFPGRLVVSFGMMGCNFRCEFCQNWNISQAIRESHGCPVPERVTAEAIASLAKQAGSPLVVSTYNEPFISAEWAVDVFRAAREAGIGGAMVSNGYGTPEALDYLRPWVQCLKIDLKGFKPALYRKTIGGVLDRVRESIRGAVDRGYWVEVVTLLIPGINDGGGELADLAGFLASISRDIPWHVTAFHPAYRMTGPRAAVAEDILRACEIGDSAGLRFVYAGNLPGTTRGREDTRCPNCSRTVLRRNGFSVLDNGLLDGACPHCRTSIPGIWGGVGGVPTVLNRAPLSL